MGNCAPLDADSFLFCIERDFMLSLSDNNQTDNVIEALNSTSRSIDELINIDYPHFEQIVGQIYHTKRQLNMANHFDTEAPCLDLSLYKLNAIVSSKIYDKRDGFNFKVVTFRFFMEMFLGHLPMVT